MINRPRGTRDLGPDEMEIRNNIEDVLRRVCRDYGYREVLTPTFESTELFLKKSGPSIVEEIYAFKDKSGRRIALRPEFTASVMRMYAESLREEPKPLKLFYFGPAFRYERPQSGRYREFWHFGTELIGPDTARADAENISLAMKSLQRLGLENYTVKVSNLAILEKFFDEKEISKEKKGDIYHLIDKEEIEEAQKVWNDIDSIDLVDLDALLNAPLSNLKTMLDDETPINYLEKVFEVLENYGIDKEDYRFDLNTVRGLDYYRGVVFEIDAEELGAQKQICGGGDYNLGDIFGLDISSKGFAIGFDRLLLALKEKENLPELDRPECFIVPIGKESLEYSYDILDELRDHDLISDIELMGRGVGKALGYADKKEFKFALLIGENEVKNGTVTIKDMDSGEQEEVHREKIVDEVEKGGF